MPDPPGFAAADPQVLGGPGPEPGTPATQLEADVRAALDQVESRAYAESYLELLTANWIAVKTAARTTLGLLLASAAAFSLIAAAQLKSATVAGLEVSNFSTIEKLLPVVVAYFGFQLVVLHTASAYLQRLHSYVHGVTHPGLRRRALHVALRPVAVSWWEASTFAHATATSGRMAQALGQVWALATMIGIALFEVLAYIHLLHRYGANWAVLVSLVLTLLLTARAVAEQRLEADLDAVPVD